MSEGHTARRGSGREIPALLALVVWAGGFEIAPFLHAVDHDHIAPHSHSHGAGAHEHEGEDDVPDPEHGQGSLAHRGLAAHTAPPALPPIDPPSIGTVRFERELEVTAPSIEGEPPRARAPPG